MESVDPSLVERYQMILQQDPASKVFAPLSEAYRKMGMLDEALCIGEAGVARHPLFPSGRVALAKVLLEKNHTEKAVDQLKIASELSPENILAHSLLADALMELKRPKEALKAFKMVLFLNPKDEKVQKIIRKLESLTANEYDEEVFQMQKISKVNRKVEPLVPNFQQRTLERFISLADAYTVRNDAERAFETLESAENILGSHPEIEKRKSLLKSRMQSYLPPEELDLPPIHKSSKVQRLEALLARIRERAR